VLLFAIAAVVLVGALAAALTAVSVAVSRAGRRAESDARLLNAAESGAELAVGKLAGGAPWTGAKDLAVPGGKCDVFVKRTKSGGWEITSRAARRRRSCQVRLTVRPAGAGRLRVTAWDAARRVEPPKKRGK